MRALLFFFSWGLALFLIFTAVQLFLDKNKNPELYYFKNGTYESYISETTGQGLFPGQEYFIVDLTEPIQVNKLTFEEYMQDIQDYNDRTNTHYRTFLSQKLYLVLFLVAAYLAVSNIILRLDLKEEEAKNELAREPLEKV